MKDGNSVRVRRAPASPTGGSSLGGLGTLFVVAAILALSGCLPTTDPGRMGAGSMPSPAPGPTVAVAPTAGRAAVRLRLQLDDRGDAPDLRSALRADGAAGATQVRCRLTSIRCRDLDRPTETFAQVVPVVGGAAEVEFNDVPAAPSLIRADIEGGNIAGFSAFHGANDLQTGVNTVVIAPVGSGFRADVVARTVERVVAQPALFAQVPADLVTTVAAAVGSVDRQSAGAVEAMVAQLQNRMTAGAAGIEAWTRVSAAPGFSARNLPAVAVFANALWLVGGYDGAYRRDVWTSSDGAVWRQITAEAPFPGRTGHALVAFNDRLWVIGGLTQDPGGTLRRLNDVWSSSDGRDWTQVTAAAAFSPRLSAAVAVHAGRVWLTGGYDGAYRNDVWSSVDLTTWTRVIEVAPFAPRAGHAMACFNGELWLGGGTNRQVVFDDIWHGNDGIAWTAVTPAVPTARRCYHAMVVGGGALWLLGGLTGSDYVSDVQRSTDGSTYVPAGGAPVFTARDAHAAAVFQNRLWVIGGEAAGPARLGDVWSRSLEWRVPVVAPPVDDPNAQKVRVVAVAGRAANPVSLVPLVNRPTPPQVILAWQAGSCRREMVLQRLGLDDLDAKGVVNLPLRLPREVAATVADGELSVELRDDRGALLRRQMSLAGLQAGAGTPVVPGADPTEVPIQLDVDTTAKAVVYDEARRVAPGLFASIDDFNARAADVPAHRVFPGAAATVPLARVTETVTRFVLNDQVNNRTQFLAGELQLEARVRDQVFVGQFGNETNSLAPNNFGILDPTIGTYVVPPPGSGLISGVTVSSDRQPVAGVTVRAQPAGLAVTTDAQGGWRLILPWASPNTLSFSAPGRVSAEYLAVVATAAATQLEPVMLLTDPDELGDGEVSGQIRNAVTGAAAGGVVLNLRSGINARAASGRPVVASVTTDGEGRYRIAALPAGNYTAEAACPGFETYHFTVRSVGKTAVDNQNAAISPADLADGHLRIRLFWGATPSDLDSHFTGPRTDSADRFRIYFGNKIYQPPDAAVPAAELDLDDTSAYGPETITVRQQLPGGVYRFTVHNFSNRSATDSTALADSQAEVVVSRGAEVIARFFPPPGQIGTVWSVFELTDNTLTPINTLTNSDQFDAVAAIRWGHLDWRLAELDALRRLPATK